MLTYEFEQNIYLMAKACNKEQKATLLQAYDKISQDIEQSGLNNVYGLVSFEESILSANTYFSISNAICNIEDKVIIDCGCGEGLQQVFFKNAKKYIGIDLKGTFFKICDNAEFLKGDVCNILPKLKIDNNTIGISVLCGMCFKNVNTSMKKYFNELIII